MKRILVIRRDNIGDLVCTTPLIHALRARYPEAWIGALVTRYNAEVLAGSPDLDAVLSYQKAKHRAPGESALKTYLQRIAQIWRLRRMKLDAVILPASGHQPSALRFARWLAPRQIHVPHLSAGHEVERAMSSLAGLGITAAPGPLHLTPDAAACAAVDAALPGPPAHTVAIHISARKPSQRWPAEHFAALMRVLHEKHGTRFVLLWSPGAQDNPLHPGDDAKAARIQSLTQGLPVLAYPTHTLKTLIAALSVTDSVVCSDGGAMHLAAGLGKAIVCFFGSSDVATWRPWGVPHRVLQPASREVADVSVEAAYAAWVALMTPA